MTNKLLPRLAALACFTVLPAFSSTPASAASSDAALLMSYAGSYAGTGAVSSSPPQRISCRINMQPNGASKLAYSGRCSAGGTSFALTGVISEAGGKFTAAMQSSGGMAGNMAGGTVTGSRKSNGIVFSSKTRDASNGHDRTINSNFALVSGSIRIDFNMLDNKTGKTIAGSVAFAKS